MPHRSKRRFWPEFGKNDALAKNRIDPNAGFGRSLTKSMRRQRTASIQTQALAGVWQNRCADKEPHRSKRRLWPEFDKIDAQTKNRIDPNAGFGRSLTKLMRRQKLEPRIFNRNRKRRSISLLEHRIYPKTASHFSVRCSKHAIRPRAKAEPAWSAFQKSEKRFSARRRGPLRT